MRLWQTKPFSNTNFLAERNFENVENQWAHSKLFQDPAYWVLISFEDIAGRLRAVAGVLRMGGSPSHVHIAFIPSSLWSYMKSANAPALRTGTKPKDLVYGLLSLHISVWGLQASIWFGIVENLAVDQFMQTPYIYRFFFGVLRASRKVVSIHSGPVAIRTSLPKFTPVLEEYVQNDTGLNESEKLRYFTSRIGRPALVQQSTKASITVTSPAAGPSLIESRTGML